MSPLFSHRQPAAPSAAGDPGPGARRLRVLLVSNLFPTPAETYRGIFTYQLAQRLRRWCDVTPLCPLPWFPRLGALASLARWHAYSEVPSRYEMGGFAVYSPKYAMLPRVSEALHPLLMFPALALAAARLHRRDPFDLVHAHWLYPDGVAAAWVARLLGLPLVLTALGSDVNLALAQRAKRVQILDAMRRAQAVTFVSDALRRRAEQEGGVDPAKLLVIPNGVSTELFRPMDRADCRRQLGLPPEPRIILFVGQLRALKGIRHLLEAARLMRAKGLDFQAYLIGEAPAGERWDGEIRERGLAERVHLAGGKRHEEIATWMGAADLLCLPSLHEGLPNVVLEALSCGRPVVASRVGGIPEVVDGRNGLLVEPGSGPALAQALQAALERAWDPEEIHRSVARFSWEAAAERTFAVLQGSLARHRGGP